MARLTQYATKVHRKAAVCLEPKLSRDAMQPLSWTVDHWDDQQACATGTQKLRENAAVHIQVLLAIP